MKHKRSLNFSQIIRKTNKYRNLCTRFKNTTVKKCLSINSSKLSISNNFSISIISNILSILPLSIRYKLTALLQIQVEWTFLNTSMFEIYRPTDGS